MSANDRPRALVLGVQLPGVDDGEHRSSLEELSRLGHTLGYDIIGQLSQRRGSLSKASVCGRGKLKELARWTGGTGFIPSAAKNAKRALYEQLLDTLGPARAEYARLIADKGYIRQLLRDGAERARTVAQATLRRVTTAAGFVP